MDKDKKIAELEAKIKEQEATIKDKEEHINKKTEDIKRLRDMSEEEKAQLTEAEKNLMKRQEALQDEMNKKTADLEAKQKAFEKSQTDFFENQRQSKIANAIKARVNGDPELTKKIEENLKLFAGKPESDEDITRFVQNAFSMIPRKESDPMLDSHNKNNGGDNGSNSNGTDGAVSAETMALAKTLGLGDVLAPAKKEDGKPDGGKGNGEGNK